MNAPKKGGPGGRPPHAPTEASTKQVEAMASYGIPQEDISKVLGITANTLRRHYSATLAVAETKANAVVAQRLFQKTAGDGQSAVTAHRYLESIIRYDQQHITRQPANGVKAALVSLTVAIETMRQQANAGAR